MKHVVSIVLVFLVLASIVSARDIPNIAEFLPTVTKDTTIMIAGDEKADGDALFTLNTVVFDGDVKSYNHYHPQIDDERGKKNLIIVGGPCVNTKYWQEFSDETCENWPLKEGEAIVKIVEDDEFVALLVAGTTKEDTLRAAERMGAVPHHSDFQHLKTILEVPGDGYVPLCEESSSYCARLEKGIELPMKAANETIQLKLGEFYPDISSIALWVNGERSVLARGETIKEGKVEFTYDNIVFQDGKPVAAFLRTTSPFKAQFDSFAGSGDSGIITLRQGKLSFLRFADDETVINLRLQIADESHQRTDIVVNGIPRHLAGAESVLVEGVNLTLQFVEGPVDGISTAQFMYRRNLQDD